MTTEANEETKKMLASEKETDTPLPVESGIPESMNDPSYTDSVSSTNSHTALLQNDKSKDDDEFVNESFPENEPSSNHSSFWDISDFGHEISGKMSMREKRREREKGHGLLESIAYMDPLVPPSPDVNRLRSVCRNAVQSLSQEIVYRSMSVLAINEKEHNIIGEKGTIEAVEIEVEEIGFINNHLRNLIFLSIGISLVSTATGSLRNLLSSMHHESGIGVYSLAASYGAFTFFSLISPFVVQRFRPKISLVAGIFTQLIYVTAILLPNFYVLIPASFLQGMGNSLLWNAMSTYTSYLARASAIKNGKKTVDVASKYFGIFFFFYQFSFVVGNLISSIILLFGPGSQEQTSTITTRNILNVSSWNESQYDLNMLHQNNVNMCGSKFCNHFKMENANMHVSQETAGTLIGVYGMCVVVALVVSHVLLDPIVTYQTSGFHCHQIFNQVRSVLKCIIDRKFLLIILLLMYSMMQLGFAAAEMTKAFVSCPLGIHMVGYTMIAYGICGGFSSWICGILCEYVGRVTLISLGRFCSKRFFDVHLLSAERN